MASIPPRTAPQNWLLRASTKYEKSIFRMAEFKYKSVIKNLENLLKAQEYELADQETKIFDLEDRVKELEVKLAPFIKPVVATKDLQAEVYRIIPTVEKEKSENKGKRKLDLSKEIGELEELRDAPPTKILKVGPTPRSILPPPGIPKKTPIKKSREHSTSPKILVPNKPKKSVLKRERSPSPTQPKDSETKQLVVDLVSDIVRREGKKKKVKEKKKS
jgi:hypothetical protein